MVVFVRLCIYIWMSVCVDLSVYLHQLKFAWNERIESHPSLLVCKRVSACFIQCPWVACHILMMSPWSNYSAACTTLSMWHTISRQLTRASECQPIGCAIISLSDISIATAQPVVTLKQQGAEIKVRLSPAQSVSSSAFISFLCLLMHHLLHPPPPLVLPVTWLSSSCQHVNMLLVSMLSKRLVWLL